MYKSTIVTMYFNLKDLKDSSPQTRPQSFYMENGRATLKLQNPMVIFCDSSTYNDIKKIRDEEVKDPLLTSYVQKNITEYDFYKENWGIINENRTYSRGYKDPNERNTPSYCLLCMFKATAISIARQNNYYDTQYYAWIDFGASHVVRNFEEFAPKMLNNPNQKISFCYIHYRGTDELKSMYNYLEFGGQCGVAGTIYTVQKEYVYKFYKGMFSIFNEMVFHSVGHNDEQAMTYFYDRYPNRCTIYYGDYYSVLSNYHEPIDDYMTIRRFFIDQTILKGRKDLAIECANKILETVKNNKLWIDDNERKYLENLQKKIDLLSSSNDI